jgi:SnoaL-like protein
MPMTDSPPTIIFEYLAASDRQDVDAVVNCFTSDATVIDEDKDWQGHARIREWRTTVANAYEYTVVLRGTVALGELDGVERYDVYTHLEGNFPGGTVDLTNRFGLRDEHIASLEIVPTDNTQS